MATLADTLMQNRENILAMAARRGATHVRIFGSVARGEDGPESDIDLLVEMEQGRSLIDLIGFALDVEEAVGRRVDVVSEGGLSPYIRDRVMGEAIPL